MFNMKVVVHLIDKCNLGKLKELRTELRKIVEKNPSTKDWTKERWEEAEKDWNKNDLSWTIPLPPYISDFENDVIHYLVAKDFAITLTGQYDSKKIDFYKKIEFEL